MSLLQKNCLYYYIYEAGTDFQYLDAFGNIRGFIIGGWIRNDDVFFAQDERLGWYVCLDETIRYIDGYLRYSTVVLNDKKNDVRIKSIKAPKTVRSQQISTLGRPITNSSIEEVLGIMVCDEPDVLMEWLYSILNMDFVFGEIRKREFVEKIFSSGFRVLVEIREPGKVMLLRADNLFFGNSLGPAVFRERPDLE